MYLRPGSNAIKRVAAYIRIAPILGESPEEQINTVVAWLGQQGLPLSSEFVDETFGGANEKRHALQSLLAEARLGRFDMVVVTSLSKLFRDQRQMATILTELEDLNVQVVAVEEAFDSFSDAGKKALATLKQIYQLERSASSERIRIAIAAKQLTAEQTNSKWRIGRPKLSKELTAHVHTLRSQGLSIRAIERRLDRVVSKTTIARLVKGGRR